MQHIMSTKEDTFWAPIGDAADVGKEDFSFESFEQDVEEMEMLRDWPYLPYQETFSNFPGTFPVTTTPSSFTLSTASDSEPSPSQYSFEFASSDCGTFSDIVAGSPVEQGVYSPSESIYADVTSNDSSTLVSSPTSPPHSPFKAHSDYGTSDPWKSFFEISPEELAMALQRIANAPSPTPPPFPVAPSIQAYATPERPFQCPLCPFTSKRKFNLKTHIGTHYKEKSKKFRCTTCSRRFSRKHDLKRHHETMHSNLKSSSSAYSTFAVASGPTAIGIPMGFPVYYHGI